MLNKIWNLRGGIAGKALSLFLTVCFVLGTMLPTVFADKGAERSKNTAATADNKDTRIGVIFDTTDFKELTPNCEYMLDALLYVKLQSFKLFAQEAYTKDTVLLRVKELEGDNIRVITVTPSEKNSALLTYPAWRIVYQKGTNEDTRLCTDLYFQTDTGEYRVHTSVGVDYAQEYKDVIERILASVSLAAKDE